MRSLPLVLLALAACGPKTAEVESSVEVAPAFDRSQAPAPLERTPFTIPTVATGELSNGLAVNLVEDHSVPVVNMTIRFTTGGWTNPEGAEALAQITFDMLNEGAGELDAVELSTAQRRLATDIGTSADMISGRISLKSLVRNLEPSLDLLSSVLLEPTFPESEWELLRARKLQDLSATRADPEKIARRVLRRVLFGDEFAGRLSNEDALNAITVEQMREWWGSHGVASNAAIFASGDITMEELLPMLEARLGSWEAGEALEVASYEVQSPEESTIYFVDKPGAAQSVLRFYTPTPGPGEAGYEELRLGNQAFGGMFTARLNMNLREDKGYTYGAHSWTQWDLAPGRWYLGTSVRTDATGASVAEIQSELAFTVAGATERPVADEEIEYARANIIQGYPGRFETPSYLLGQLADVWIHDLPADWIEGYISRIDAVTPDAARSAFSEYVATKPLSGVVVGDWAAVGEGLEALGFTIVQLDVDGNPISEE